MPAATLDGIRSHASSSLAQLPEGLRQLREPFEYPVEISHSLRDLAAQVDRDTLRRRA